MITPTEQFAFLPGAFGNTRFWQPVADRLITRALKVHVGWPGFGEMPLDPDVTGMDDLVTLVLAEIDRPTALVAQSMGGIVAVRVALERPELITHLVLAVTSGGVDVSALGGQDWREEFVAENPAIPRWFVDEYTNLTHRLAELQMAVLHRRGADPISPVRDGQYLVQLIPHAALHVFANAGHELGFTHSTEVAQSIESHLALGSR